MRGRCALLTTVLGFVLAGGADAGEVLSVPLRLHIITGIVLDRREVAMDSWIRSDDLRREVVPAVNRIWRQAGIEWRLEGIHVSEALSPADRGSRIDRIVTAKRDATGRSDPARIRAWEGLIDFRATGATGVDVFLVPYLGETSQGRASRRDRRALVALWTDKPSRGREPPQRVKLVEPEPFVIGSLSRTMAHELGHIVGLRHPNKAKQKRFGRLMGGRQPGEQLTRRERRQARAGARALPGSE